MPLRRSIANDLANLSIPPLASIDRCKKPVNLSTSISIAGAKAATVWSVTPLNKPPSFSRASFVFSTPTAALVDMVKPSARASPSIAAKPSLPSPSVLTSAAPSESNSLNANLSLSDSLLTPPKASARVNIFSSSGILLRS